jgi:hypothetical protein
LIERKENVWGEKYLKASAKSKLNKAHNATNGVTVAEVGVKCNPTIEEFM